MNIDAKDMHYRDLNRMIRSAVSAGDREFTLVNVEGQRYIGTGLGDDVKINIHGVPGNDLAAFMNGASIVIEGNAQDGVGNTMNRGRIAVHGDAGDILGYSMRGGKVLVEGSVGYRSCIHMKALSDRLPAVVIGGGAGSYLGEYMAGGVLVVLGLDHGDVSPVGEYVGTGMHGGVIYIRGKIEDYQVGREVGIDNLTDADWEIVSELIDEFMAEMNVPTGAMGRDEFVKLSPKSSRPYGTLYAY